MPKSEPADLSASIWASQQSLPVASTERSPVHKWTATNSPFVDWLWLTSISTRGMSASRIQISIQYVYVIVDMRYPHIDYYTTVPELPCAPVQARTCHVPKHLPKASGRYLAWICREFVSFWKSSATENPAQSELWLRKAVKPVQTGITKSLAQSGALDIKRHSE